MPEARYRGSELSVDYNAYIDRVPKNQSHSRATRYPPGPKVQVLMLCIVRGEAWVFRNWQLALAWGDGGWEERSVPYHYYTTLLSLRVLQPLLLLLLLLSSRLHL